MAELSAGQNSELGSYELAFTVAPARVSVAALVLDGQGRARPGGYIDHTGPSRHRGIVAHPGRLSVDLGTVAAEVARVLCVALDPEPGSGALSCTLIDGHGQRIGFTVTAADVHPAVISFELYRRGPRWKARAVGQGYAGGAAEMARVQGIPAVEPPAAPSMTAAAARASVRSAAPSPSVVPITPLGNQAPLERISMIYEDASRSTAALLTAYSFADTRRDAEMTAAVANQATRNSGSGREAVAEAQRRYHELIAAATCDYQRDAAHLVAELEALDGQLPSALASWAAPAWQRPPQPANGIRLGMLTVPDAGPLAIPLCLPTPMHRPVWIDTREPAAATPVSPR